MSWPAAPERDRVCRPNRQARFSAEQVQQAVAHAQRDNPTIVDQISGFYA
jgi:hypothetical protein